jgi:GGDEF domain-containing protein
MGDQVLRAFADIIRSCMRDDDLLCRSGGDEFMLFCRDMQGESDTAALIGRINERFRAAAAELMGEDYGIPLGVSAGVVFVPAAGRDYQTLFVYADKALYRAKNNGKHGYSVYNPGELAVSVESEDPAKELLRVTQVIEDRGEIGDAMLLGQDAFSWVYRFVLRYLKRYRGAALKLLFILTADSDEDLNAASEQFGDLLKQILRRSDIITQSKRNQFFLLLPELQEQNAPVVIERILSTWEMSKSKEGIRINYAIESIDYTEED